MRTHEEITVKRDVDAIQIPFGDKIVIPAGSTVTLTQSLGGSYTVSTDFGYLARVDGKDADALGKEPLPTALEQSPTDATAEVEVGAATTPEELEKQVWDQLRTVFDPEIPANVVDLGLVYGVTVQPLAEGGHSVSVIMTLTAPGCGMGDILKADAENRVYDLPGVKEAIVDMVTEPPWDPSLMSEAARLELGIF